ncbi:MAG: TonB-dependent receptor [Bacteroidetes bacterium]|nr:TonB-dependent receptor [Bacteroidota bacterium]
MKSKAILVVTLLAASRLSHAQQADTTKSVELKSVTVTATRSEKNPINVGRSVTVIGSEEIKNSGANSLAEFLSVHEGIYVVGGQQNPGSLSSLFMRGANGSQTAIMVDGIKISDPSTTDNSIDLAELSLGNIERIEIVRGSHSTLYGSSAIGGVINIITKKNNEKPGIHTDVEVKGGVFNSNGTILSENVLLNYTHKEGFYVNAEMYNTGSKGFNSTVDTVTNPNTYQHSDKSNPFRKTDLVGKLGYHKKNLDVFASYKIASQHTKIDAGAYQDDDNYTIDFNRKLFTYGASYKFNEKFSVTYYGGISNIERKAINDSSQVTASGTSNHNYFSETHKGSTMSNDLQLNYHTKGIDLVAGTNLYQETMTAQTYYYSTAYGIYESKNNLDSLKINSHTSNGFLHADLSGTLLNEKLSALNLGLGGRFVNHSLFGNVFTWEINPSLKLSKEALLYFSYTTGFNAPSLYQLYTPEKDLTSGITRGNKTLKPEESQSFEIGIKQKLNNQLWYSVAYFNTKVKNVVDYVYLWNKSTPIDSLSFSDYRGDTYVNLGTQYSHGFEFSLTSKISEKLVLFGNLSIIAGKIKYNPSGIDTSHTKDNQVQLFSNGAFTTKEIQFIGLVRRPSTANISIAYNPIKKLALRGDVRFAGARSDIYYDAALGPFGALNTVGVEDYTLFDLSARYEIIKSLTAMIRIENIFDTQYNEIMGYATRGRGFYGGIRYSF